MSDDLWAWLEQVRDERIQAQVALQNGDDGPMRLWGLRHGHVLIAKCEELAGALAFVLDEEEWHMGEDSKRVARSALRAPGGDEA